MAKRHGAEVRGRDPQFELGVGGSKKWNVAMVEAAMPKHGHVGASARQFVRCRRPVRPGKWCDSCRSWPRQTDDEHV